MSPASWFQKKIIQNKKSSILLLLLIHFGFRTVLLGVDAFPFNSDEAIVGLMAKHIIDGERPTFFYGQVYMGSLDAYLVSLFFLIFGETVLAIRIFQIVLFAITIFVFYYFVIIAFENKAIAFYASMLMVLPPVNLVLYTTVSLGGYGEALLTGIFGLLVAVWIDKALDKNNYKVSLKQIPVLLIFGINAGLGFWASALSMIFTLPAGLFLLFKSRKYPIKLSWTILALLVMFAGFLVGSFPWLQSFIFGERDLLIYELLGGAVSVEQGAYISIVLRHILSFFLFGLTAAFGLRPPWEIQWNFILLIPVVLFFWALITYKLFRLRYENDRKDVIFLVSGIVGLLFVGFVFTSFGTDPSGRYFLPLYISFSIFAGYVLGRFSPRYLILIFSVVLFYHFMGNMKYAFSEPFITTQFYAPARIDHRHMDDLIKFLDENDEMGGYTNYWIAYPMAFLSDEEIVSIPVLPYHPDLRYTTRDNRVQKYSEIVSNSSSVFYITSNNPELDLLLISRFSKNNVEYNYKEIGDYHIYYDLSVRITPEELGIY